MSEKSEVLRSEIYDWIIRHKGFDPTINFFNIDNLWIDPDVNEKFSRLICRYIEESYNAKEISAIITADTLSYPYGPVPIATLLSTYLRKPLGIVKEGNDPISGRHAYFGTSKSDNIFFFYDVTKYGISAMRLLIHLFEKGIHPRWFLSIVDFNEGAFDFINTSLKEKGKPELEATSILTIKDFL